jgi:Fic family protein
VPAAISDAVAEVAGAAGKLGQALHPRTAASLADLVRVMNTYYSNLIEGHNTRPRDIERALAGELDVNEARRNLQVEAAAHIQVQRSIDERAAAGTLPEPASETFLRQLHRDFYRDAPPEVLTLTTEGRSIRITPGEWRNTPDHDNAVGRHIPPASAHVAEFMAYFASRYAFEPLGSGSRILAIPAAHHRLNFIHPFLDGNGRVSRLMSHAMAHAAGIGAHGLWSISRGLARGLESRTEYKSMMDATDAPRRGDLDGRGTLSLAALEAFTEWFLRVALDQLRFMSGLFDLNTLAARLNRMVAGHELLKPESVAVLTETLMRGEIDRGEAPRITGLPERSARRVLADLQTHGLLDSDTPKGPMSLRFPASELDVLFPKLFPEN